VYKALILKDIFNRKFSISRKSKNQETPHPKMFKW